MIVRDEEGVSGGGVESVRGLVDEMVGVDPGARADTVAIARSHGARIGHHAWTDDFAAARNHALSLAAHPWRLVLDADEWIADREAARRLLEALRGTTPDFIGLIDIVQARLDGALSAETVPTELARLLPPSVRFVGRVHEQPRPLLEVKSLGLRVGHDGYRPEALARKEGRNTALLAAAIAEAPGNAYLHYQLGSEHAVRGAYESALPPLIEAFNLLHPESGEAPDGGPQPWWHRLTVRLMLALTALGRHEESVAVGAMEAERWPRSADFAYVRGQALRQLAGRLGAEHDAYAGQLVTASIALWREAVELGDSPDFTGTLPARATVLAARQLADDYATMGDDAEAERYRVVADPTTHGARTGEPHRHADHDPAPRQARGTPQEATLQ